MSTNKIKDQIIKRRISSERRKTSIDAVMGLTNADCPKEIKVSKHVPLARDVWTELEERIKA
jgi:hypothetical protein